MNQKMLVTIPETLYRRWRSAVPEKQRSQRLVRLIEQELAKEDEKLYQAALELENNSILRKEMETWEQSFGSDGLEGLEYDEPKKIE